MPIALDRVTPAAAPERSGRDPRQLHSFVLLVLVIALGSVSIITLYPNTDIGWLVYAGQRILDGATLYVDVIEIHPPMLFWMSAQVAHAARIAGLDALTAFDIFVLGHVLAGVALARIITREWRAPAALAVVGLPLVGIDSGEPEHLFVLAFIPYILIAERRIARQSVQFWLGLATGFLTGLAICRKPHLALGWLIVELAAAHALGARLAIRRVEAVTVALVGAFYVALVLITTPEYLTIAKYAAAAYSDYYPARAIDLVLNTRFGGVLLAVGVLLILDRGRSAKMVAAASLALLGAVFVQGHGWSYHFYPALAVPLFGVLVRALKSRWVHPIVLALASAGMLWTNLWFFEMRPWPYHMPWFREVVREHGGPVLALTTLMQPVYPLLTVEEVQPVSRFASLWPVPQAYDAGGDPFPYNSPSRMQALERFAFDSTISDFIRARPKLIFVDTLPPRMWPPERAMSGWSWLDYFAQDPRFRNEFANYYDELPAISNFRLFVRRTPAAPTLTN
jgi:hypothetical protein